MLILETVWTPESICALIVAICTALGAIAALVPTLIKLYNALKEVVKNKNWSKIFEIIKKSAIAVEKSISTGAEKKIAVMDTVKAFCEESGIEWTADLQQKISAAIDDLITVHNQLSGK